MGTAWWTNVPTVEACAIVTSAHVPCRRCTCTTACSHGEQHAPIAGPSLIGIFNVGARPGGSRKLRAFSIGFGNGSALAPVRLT